MKEFIEKLTKKLYENVKSKSCPDEACWAHLNKNCDNCDSKEIEVTDVIRIANELAEEYNGGWIPVSSGKLPDDGVPVEVTVKEDNDNGGYDLYVFESWYQDGQWVIGKNRYNPMVTAWKPKDAPYQPKGENNGI